MGRPTTTVMIMNDAVEIIAEDPGFGGRLADAVRAAHQHCLRVAVCASSRKAIVHAALVIESPLLNKIRTAMEAHEKGNNLRDYLDDGDILTALEMLVMTPNHSAISCGSWVNDNIE